MTKKAFRPEKILWVDLEMTGLDPVEDRILEVAAIVTDWDFHEIATYEAAVLVEPELLERRMTGPFWQEFDAVRQALQSASANGQASEIVEQSMLSLIQQNFNNDDKVLLAGNSIHQDRKFIEREWPMLDAKLHYRMLDVSAWKVVFEAKSRKSYNKPEAHRALDDIRGSIDELKYYLAKVKL